MRAILVKHLNLTTASNYRLEGEEFHHLSHVVRLKLQEEVLMLNGQGMSAKARVTEVDKRSLVLTVLGVSQHSRPASCDVLLLIPKRDALDLMLKMATELGVSRLYLLKGDYSPDKLPELRRIEALLQSAMEQSNNPWLPEVIQLDAWPQLPLESYRHVYLMDAQSAPAMIDTSQDSKTLKDLMVIGPEGGFSNEERARLVSLPQSRILHLPTAILRAPTALAAGIGWWHARA